MAARFKKSARVRLMNEEEDNLLEDDSEAVVESSLDKEEDEGNVSLDPERGASIRESERGVSSDRDLSAWWRRGWPRLRWGKRQYHVHPSSKNSRFCRVNSWKAVFLALFTFTMAMIISVLLSRLLREPSATGEVYLGRFSSRGKGFILPFLKF